MTIRQALAEILADIDEKEFMWPHKQQLVRQARQALADDEEWQPVHVVCNIPLCPSRLVLPPGTTRQEADEIAKRLHWKVFGSWHKCPGCSLS